MSPRMFCAANGWGPRSSSTTARKDCYSCSEHQQQAAKYKEAMPSLEKIGQALEGDRTKSKTGYNPSADRKAKIVPIQP